MARHRAHSQPLGVTQSGGGYPERPLKDRLYKAVYWAHVALRGGDLEKPPVELDFGPEHWEALSQSAAAALHPTFTQVALQNDHPLIRTVQGVVQGAHLLKLHFRDTADTLERLGCGPDDAIEYVVMQFRCLASLYHEAGRPQPSPMTLQQLAIRYVVDARVPPDEDANYVVSKEELGCLVARYPHRLQAELGHEAAEQIWIFDPFAQELLRCIRQSPIDAAAIVGIIETYLDRVPGEREGLPSNEERSVSFLVEESQGKTVVRLWARGRSVKLRNRKDIYQLLKAICEDPRLSLTGPKAQARFKVTNASQAAKEIQDSLGAAFPGGGQWLLTNPIRWAADVAVSRHSGNEPVEK